MGWPLGQAHALEVQVAVAGHSFPQVPQFLESDAKLTQAVEPEARQTSGSLLGQWHELLSQDAPAAHALAHVPQCAGSLVSDTHVPGLEPHTSGKPAGHLQAPATQTSLVRGQTCPQVRQLFASVWRSVQDVPQLSGFGARHWQVPAPHWEPVRTLAQA